eukprot:scaffold349007_cov17-Prasinocladus_malaysianus.AAC.1
MEFALLLTRTGTHTGTRTSTSTGSASSFFTYGQGFKGVTDRASSTSTDTLINTGRRGACTRIHHPTRRIRSTSYKYSYEYCSGFFVHYEVRPRLQGYYTSP